MTAHNGPNRPIRVVVVDDHTIMREPLRDFLQAQPGLSVVGDAGDAEQAVRLVETLHPDVLLLDVVLGPDEDEGVRVAERLRRSAPQTRVLVLTGVQNRDHARRLADLGVAGYLPKTISFSDIADAIRAVHAGEPPRSGS